jgi:hypothetical protein
VILFGFIYPSERKAIPRRVLDDLARKLREQSRHDPPPDKVCNGTLLSATQYVRDIDLEGYRDARLAPSGPIAFDDLAKWMANFVKP